MRLALLLVAVCAVIIAPVAGFDYPDCTAAPLSGTPICDATLSYQQRAVVSGRHSRQRLQLR